MLQYLRHARTHADFSFILGNYVVTENLKNGHSHGEKMKYMSEKF